MHAMSTEVLQEQEISCQTPSLRVPEASEFPLSLLPPKINLQKRIDNTHEAKTF